VFCLWRFIADLLIVVKEQYFRAFALIAPGRRLALMPNLDH